MVAGLVVALLEVAVSLAHSLALRIRLPGRSDDRSDSSRRGVPARRSGECSQTSRRGWAIRSAARSPSSSILSVALPLIAIAAPLWGIEGAAVALALGAAVSLAVLAWRVRHTMDRVSSVDLPDMEVLTHDR